MTLMTVTSLKRPIKSPMSSRSELSLPVNSGPTFCFCHSMILKSLKSQRSLKRWSMNLALQSLHKVGCNARPDHLQILLAQNVDFWLFIMVLFRIYWGEHDIYVHSCERRVCSGDRWKGGEMAVGMPFVEHLKVVSSVLNCTVSCIFVQMLIGSREVRKNWGVYSLWRTRNAIQCQK